MTDISPDAEKRGPGRPPKEQVPDGYVRVRVLPRGDNKIHMGGTVRSLATDHDKFDGAVDPFPKYKKGERFALPKAIAAAQEENGYVEIEE